MSVPEDWIKIYLTPGQVEAGHGPDRQQYAEQRGFRPNGLATTGMHTSGDLAELAVAEYLGTAKPDWRWEADKTRGYDVGGFQVRSAKRPDDPMSLFLRDARNLDAVYIFVLTHNSPVMYLAGWITAGKGLSVGVRGSTRKGQPVQCWYVDQRYLTPLPPAWGQLAA